MDTWTEKIQVAGDRVVTKIRELVKEGNVRKIIIRKPDGSVLKEFSLTAGVAIGGLALWIAPILAAIGAVIGVGMNYTIEVVRSQESSPDERSED
ncbi:MAG TPA: DUF4342 domain-containing protein [Spirochaetia bacterium]|nr:DUF4342 domain-containing protein [Spirochaetia bacterium]